LVKEQEATSLEIVGDMPFLVPGIGAQGGDIQAAVIGEIDQHGAGTL
jgi:orotidine-5'-phosphate decarboxylase